MRLPAFRFLKGSFFLLLPLFAGPGAAAQGLTDRDASGHDRNFFIYLDAGGGGGFSYYGQAHVRIEFARHHELSFGYQVFTRRSKQPPADYTPAGLVLSEGWPQDKLDGLGLSYAYIHPLVRNHGGALLRLSLRGGVVLGGFTQPYNFRQSGSFFTTWHYDKQRQPATGIMIQPGMIITPREGFGFSSGVFAAVYRNFSSFGLYASFLVGHITDRNTRKFPKSAI